MTQLTQPQVIDLSMNIIKDSKRRLLYWDSKEKKGYQIKDQDIKWIKIYAMLFVFGIFIFTILQLVIHPLYSLGIAVLVVFVYRISFKLLFFKDKVPFKVHEKDLELLNHPAVTKQQRSLEIYKTLFVVLLGFLEIMKAYEIGLGEPLSIIAIIIIIALLAYRLYQLHIIHSKHKYVTRGDA